MNLQGRILVIRGGAIGDFILTLPVLQALRRAFPACRLDLIAYPRMGELARAAGLVDEVVSIESRALASFFSRKGPEASPLSHYLAEQNLIVSYLYDPDGIFLDNIRRCSSAQVVQGIHRPREEDPIHATAALLQPLERLAIFDADPVPRLPLPPVPQVDAPGRLLALHPGSGSDSKNWPEPNWQRLLSDLAADTDVRFLLVAGEAEAERVRHLVGGLPAHRFETAVNLPLVDVARRMSGCHGFVGHDSGITHLAAAIGLPCVVLWGPSREPVWRPLGPSVRVLRSPGGLTTLGVKEVAAAVKDLLAGAKDAESR